MTKNEFIRAYNKTELETLQVGPVCSHHERAVGMIGNCQVLMDTVIPSNWFKPSETWWYCWFEFPKTKAESIAKKFPSATVIETPYPSELGDEFYLSFTNENEFLNYVWEYHKDELNKAKLGGEYGTRI